MASFLKVIDEGLRALIYAKFKDVMDLGAMRNSTILYPKAIALRKISERKEKDEVEFINLWRESTERDFSRQRTSVARDGINVAFTDTTSGSDPSEDTDENTGITTVRAVPVTLGYSIWFWSKDKEILNEVAELYLFWQHSDPNLNLYYNDLYPVEFDLHFGDISDESTTAEMFTIGEYFVIRAPIEIDGWVFTDIDVKTVKKIVITYWDQDEIADEDITDFLEDPDDDLNLFEVEYDLSDAEV